MIGNLTQASVESTIVDSLKPDATKHVATLPNLFRRRIGVSRVVGLHGDSAAADLVSFPGRVPVPTALERPCSSSIESTIVDFPGRAQVIPHRDIATQAILWLPQWRFGNHGSHLVRHTGEIRLSARLRRVQSHWQETPH